MAVRARKYPTIPILKGSVLSSKSDHPLCSATLRSGDACTHVAVTEDGLCQPCARKAAAETERAEGPSGLSEMEGAQDSRAEEFEFTETEPRPEPVPVESLRAALRENASTAEVAELMQAMLLDGLRASKTVYSSCRRCGTRSPVALPDMTARIAAMRALVEETSGKLRQVNESADQRLEALRQAADKDLDSMTDEELTLLSLGQHDDAWPSMKDAARGLAEALLEERAADPRGWANQRLTPDEWKLIRVATATYHWGRWPDGLFDLAEQVLVGSSPTEEDAL